MALPGALSISGHDLRLRSATSYFGSIECASDPLDETGLLELKRRRAQRNYDMLSSRLLVSAKAGCDVVDITAKRRT